MKRVFDVSTVGEQFTGKIVYETFSFEEKIANYEMMLEVVGDDDDSSKALIGHLKLIGKIAPLLKEKIVEVSVKLDGSEEFTTWEAMSKHDKMHKVLTGACNDFVSSMSLGN